MRRKKPLSIITELEVYRDTIAFGAPKHEATLWRFVFSALIEILKKVS